MDKISKILHDLWKLIPDLRKLYLFGICLFIFLARSTLIDYKEGTFWFLLMTFYFFVTLGLITYDFIRVLNQLLVKKTSLRKSVRWFITVALIIIVIVLSPYLFGFTFNCLSGICRSPSLIRFYTTIF